MRTLGHFTECEAELTAALRMFPDESRLRTEEGWLHFNRGDYVSALECFERADPTENAFRGKAAVFRKRGEYDKANDLVDKALDHLRTSPPLLTERGWILFDRGRYTLKENPADPDANILMGWVRLRTGVIDEADLHFSRALHARPRDPIAIEGKARAAIAMRDWARAEEILRDGLDANPKDHRRDLYLLLAGVLISRGDETKSRHFYQEALTQAKAAMGYAQRRVPAIRHEGSGPSVADSHPQAPATPEVGDPWFFAAVASYRMSARSRAEGHAGTIPRRDAHERRAVNYLHTCLDKKNPRHREAAHLLAQLEDQRFVTPEAVGQWSIAVVAIALLATLWVAFLKSNRVSQNTVVILSPILIGLLVITSLLPYLERFKLPGVEADVRSPPGELESPPPLGNISLGELTPESLSPGTDRATLPIAPQAPGNVRRHSAAVISISALVGETNNTRSAGKSVPRVTNA